MKRMEEELAERIRRNRMLMKSGFGGEELESDQQRGLPQPPLAKPPSGGERISLPEDFATAVVSADYWTLVQERKSCRVYKEDALTLEQLSFLLWTTQGVKGIRGNRYATIRPVPSAGARHPFETYLAVFRVEGLREGIYHYLPLEHALEYIGEEEHLEEAVTFALCDQKWAAKAPVTFFYSAVPYRSEWRYSDRSHRVMLLDAGHVMQNLYLSSHAIGCGTCAIAAFEQEAVDRLLRLDGEEEFVIYAAPVGVQSH
ncbi:SagB/ThcOx family dehydrogenase [Gorillibacterium sp. sgz5001074]|uniref:SagB/ThcOx family dehydrogenase n=1 Tax=Gorillibacterium sp. sgz5001074 TaxID=3446695 RepID=UPI003F6740C0